MSTDEKLRCPVCRAMFRSSPECSRCGADLTKLMTIAARSHFLCQAARDALQQDHIDQAKKLTQLALNLHITSAAKTLMLHLHSVSADCD